MKKYLFLLCFLLSACSPSDYHTLSGEAGDFNDWHGQWVVINYWAIWCRVCITEIPEFNQLHAENNNILVFAINYDGVAGQKLEEQVSELKIKFPVLLNDPASHFGYPRPEVLPATYIFNPKGTLYRTLLGPQTKEAIEQAITN